MADDTQDLLRLADKVEKATGLNRELDLIIWFAVTGRAFLGFVREINPHGLPETYNWYGRTTGNRSVSIECAPKYTGSLDAAETLVTVSAEAAGERYRLEAYTTNGVLPEHVRASAWVPGAPRVFAATPALALCAAALKARAHSTKENTHVG